MEQLLTQFGAGAATLVAIVGGIVQQLKRFPAIVIMQKKYPVYQAASLALGIAGAYQFVLPNPIFAGIMIGLASCGAFDMVKKVEVPKSITKVIPIILLGLLLLFAGCSENMRPTTTLLSGANLDEPDSNVEYAGRLGLTDDSLEFGMAVNWWQEAPSQSYGVYVLTYLTPEDTNDLILGVPYIGAQATVYVAEDRGGMAGFLVGSARNISNNMKLLTEVSARTYGEVIEAQMGDTDDRYRGYVGLQILY